MNKHVPRAARFAFGVLALATALLTAGTAGAHSAATVNLRQTGLGRILVDSQGRTLYQWAHDKHNTSTCYGGCAAYWPSLVTRGKPRAARGVRQSLLGTTRRTDGRLQVRYHGHPLYRFAGDRRPGQTSGAGLTDFGGTWNPLSAAGLAVHKPAPKVHPILKHGVLTVSGTAAGDTIALRLKAHDPGTIQIDVRDDGKADFSIKRKQVKAIAVLGFNGNDVIRIDDSNGAFTDRIPTTLDGGGNDDTIAGGAGAETLIGGDGNDVIDGNKGNDTAQLGAGDDVFVWDPGDGSDTVEGQDGNDTMRFNDAAAAEQVTLSANGPRLRLFRDVGNVTMDTAGIETVDINTLGGADLTTINDLTGTDVTTVNVDLANTLGGTTGDGAADQVVVNGSAAADAIKVAGDTNGITVSGLHAQVAISHQEPSDQLAVHGLDGNDSIDASALAAGAIALGLDGGTGNDTIAGSQGIETLIGGDGNDTVDGNKGNDTALLGAGDDLFIWDPGDGSDIVEGQDGNDQMRFNDAPVAEQVTLSANGPRLRLFRDVGNVTMDTAGIERVVVNALGGADLTTVNDLSGTDVTSVNVDVGVGDAATDQVVVNGSAAADAIKVAGDANGVTVSGLHAQVAISHQEPTDQLTVHGLDGNDSIDASALAAGAIALSLDGGSGNDTIAGSQGVETSTGGDGNDVIDGNKGNDTAQLGAGDDVFVWDPGDGSDTVEGQDGNDTMRFNDAAATEQVTLSANGPRLRLFRDVGNITMDTAGIETVDLNTLGGADLTTINDLTGTDVTNVNVDLANTLGGTTGNGAVDRVVVTGTNGNDAITVSGDANGVTEAGLVPLVRIFHPEAADRLELNTLDGIDTLVSVGLAPGTLQLFFDGTLVP